MDRRYHQGTKKRVQNGSITSPPQTGRSTRQIPTTAPAVAEWGGGYEGIKVWCPSADALRLESALVTMVSAWHALLPATLRCAAKTVA